MYCEKKTNFLMVWGGIVFVPLFAVASFYLMNLFTPFNGDDYGYAFMWKETGQSFYLLNAIEDVFSSQYYFYQTSNGRTIVQGIAQLFTGILGKSSFNVFNTCIFGVLLWVILQFCFWGMAECRLRNKLAMFLLADLAVLYVFSFPGQTELWMCGSCNYMLAAVLSLLVVWTFLRPHIQGNILAKMSILWGLFAGWTQEAFTMPFAVALLIGFGLFKTYRTRANALLLIGYLVGICLNVFSPGTMSRLASNEVKSSGGFTFLLLSKTLNTIASLSSVPIFWVALVVVVLLVVQKHRIRTLWQDRPVAIFILLWLSNVLFQWGLGFGEERVTFALSIVSFILVCRVYRDILIRLFLCNSVICILGILFVLGNVEGVRTCREYHAFYSTYISNIRMAETQDVIMGLKNYDKPSRFIYIDDIYDDKPWRNAYFGKSSIVALPPDAFSLYERMAGGSFETVDSVGGMVLCRDAQTGLFFVEGNASARLKNVVERHSVDDSELRPHQRVIRSLLKSQDTGKGKAVFHSFVYAGKPHYFFRLPPFAYEVQLLFAGEDTVAFSLR